MRDLIKIRANKVPDNGEWLLLNLSIWNIVHSTEIRAKESKEYLIIGQSIF